VVPCVIVVAGQLVEALVMANSRQELSVPGLGRTWLAFPQAWLEWTDNPLGKSLAFLGAMAILGMLGAILLLLVYRLSIRHALDIEVQLRRRLHAAHLEHAFSDGLTAQLSWWQDAEKHWIPQLREGLLAWHRHFFRYLTQAALCLLLAGLIDPWLTLFAILAAFFLWQLYRWLERQRWRTRPIYADRSRSALERLSTLTQRGPLLAATHSPTVLESNLESQLRAYRQAELHLHGSYLWKTPLLMALVAELSVVFGALLVIHALRPQSPLALGSGLSLTALLGFGLVSLTKVVRSSVRRASTQGSAQRFLNRFPVPVTGQAKGRREVALPLAESIALEAVAVDDVDRQRALDQVSFVAKRGTLVALASTSDRGPRILAELLMGFGLPTSGRMYWDQLPYEQLAPPSLAEHCLWIDRTGPLMAGTLWENLSLSSEHRPLSEMVDATRAAGVYESVADLPDAFSTMLSSDDDRLSEEALFRLGVARALLRRVQLVVAEEPQPADALAERAPLLDSLRLLKDRGCLVVVLARSLAVLREADQVVVLEEGRAVATGTHRELLERHECYRHLNYMLFLSRSSSRHPSSASEAPGEAPPAGSLNS
jgi:ABC-type transport system involved in cytochrome bd biosynthesis fused ATPase/permease subunit